MNSDIPLAFMARSKYQIDHARDKINHCLDQLRTDDVWWTPRDPHGPSAVSHAAEAGRRLRGVVATNYQGARRVSCPESSGFTARGD